GSARWESLSPKFLQSCRDCYNNRRLLWFNTSLNGLLGAEFSFLPAEVVSPASSASVGVWRVSGPTRPTYLEEQPVLLSELLLHSVGYGHTISLTSCSPSLSYIVAVGPVVMLLFWSDSAR